MGAQRPDSSRATVPGGLFYLSLKFRFDSRRSRATNFTASAPHPRISQIVRHGAGPSSIYVVTFHRLDGLEIAPKPVLAEGARLLIDLLERLGVNLELREVRGALEDILRLGSANIPGLWLGDEQMAEKGLVED